MVGDPYLLRPDPIPPMTVTLLFPKLNGALQLGDHSLARVHVRGRPSMSCRAVISTDRHRPNALTVGEDGFRCALQGLEVGGFDLPCRQVSASSFQCPLGLLSGDVRPVLLHGAKNYSDLIDADRDV